MFFTFQVVTATPFAVRKNRVQFTNASSRIYEDLLNVATGCVTMNDNLTVLKHVKEEVKNKNGYTAIHCGRVKNRAI